MKTLSAVAAVVLTSVLVACGGSSDGAGSSAAAETVGADSAKACQTVADCTGKLSSGKTQTCSDGTEQADAWACIASACVVDACEAHGGIAGKPIDCDTAQYQTCDEPSDCAGALPSGWSWGCTNETPLSACNYSEPVCIAADDVPDCSTAKFQSCDQPSDCTGKLASGWSWSCNNETPLSACNYGEPICVKVH